jgi:excisionase family DNA binding protein
VTGIEQFYTTAELAKLLKMKQQTIRAWIRDGKINAAKFGGENGDYRIPHSEAERLVNDAYGSAKK